MLEDSVESLEGGGGEHLLTQLPVQDLQLARHVLKLTSESKGTNDPRLSIQFAQFDHFLQKWIKSAMIYHGVILPKDIKTHIYHLRFDEIWHNCCSQGENVKKNVLCICDTNHGFWGHKLWASRPKLRLCNIIFVVTENTNSNISYVSIYFKGVPGFYILYFI